MNNQILDLPGTQDPGINVTPPTGQASAPSHETERRLAIGILPPSQVRVLGLACKEGCSGNKQKEKETKQIVDTLDRGNIEISDLKGASWWPISPLAIPRCSLYSQHTPLHIYIYATYLLEHTARGDRFPARRQPGRTLHLLYPPSRGKLPPCGSLGQGIPSPQGRTAHYVV